MHISSQNDQKSYVHIEAQDFFHPHMQFLCLQGIVFCIINRTSVYFWPSRFITSCFNCQERDINFLETFLMQLKCPSLHFFSFTISFLQSFRLNMTNLCCAIILILYVLLHAIDIIETYQEAIKYFKYYLGIANQIGLQSRYVTCN